jgi:hypothetical protein
MSRACLVAQMEQFKNTHIIVVEEKPEGKTRL